MNTSVKLLLFSILLSLACGLSGCATGSGAHRFYSGPALPQQNVVLVYAVGGCRMREVRIEPDPKTRHLDFMKSAGSDMLDLLPGQYVIGVTYSYSSTSLQTHTHAMGDKARLPLNAGPGNIYVVYPTIDPAEQTWNPVLVNLNGYDSNACQGERGCPDQEKIQQKAAAYLQGERPVMNFHPLSETPYYVPVTEEAKREIKGFWW